MLSFENRKKSEIKTDVEKQSDAGDGGADTWKSDVRHEDEARTHRKTVWLSLGVLHGSEVQRGHIPAFS